VPATGICESAPPRQPGVAAPSRPCRTRRAHPKYVLERHVGTYQALRPDAAPAAGLHKGERFWLRADVVELHTAEQWLTAGRQARARPSPLP